MINQITMNRYRLLFTCLLLSLLCGCALGEPLLGPDNLTIDKVPSDKMHIVYVDVRRINRVTNISGKAKFNRGMIGSPSDHLIVTIIDPSGSVLDTVRVPYYRNGKPTRIRHLFKFSLAISQTIPNGSTVRVENDES